jgi:hypothetical protein
MQATRAFPIIDIERIAPIRRSDGSFSFALTLRDADEHRRVVRVGAAALVTYRAMRKRLLRDYGVMLDITDVDLPGGPRWEDLVAYALGQGEV